MTQEQANIATEGMDESGLPDKGGEGRRWRIYCAEGPPDDERINGPYTDGWVEVVEAGASQGQLTGEEAAD